MRVLCTTNRKKSYEMGTDPWQKLAIVQMRAASGDATFQVDVATPLLRLLPHWQRLTQVRRQVMLDTMPRTCHVDVSRAAGRVVSARLSASDARKWAKQIRQSPRYKPPRPKRYAAGPFGW